MLNIKVGYSKNNDAFMLGKETADSASKLGNVKLGMLYSSPNMNYDKLLQGVRTVLGNKPIIGSTTDGLIVPDGFIDDGQYAGMMCFSDDDLIVGVAGSKAGDDVRKLGKKIAREAITNAGVKKVPSYFYMVASPKEEEEYLKGIKDVIGTVPFFGGSAADGQEVGNWKIICNDEIFDDGCAVAFFYAKNEFKNEFTGAYDETNNVGIITNTAGERTILEIDGVPALKKYAEWTNQDINDLMGVKVFNASLLKPLGVKDPTGALTIVRHPTFSDNHYAMDIGNQITTNIAVIQLTTTVDELIKSNSLAINNLNKKMKHYAAGYFLVHSLGRKRAMHNRYKEIYDEIVKTINKKEFMMIFTYGEYGANDHSANTCGDLMLSFSSFSE